MTDTTAPPRIVGIAGGSGSGKTTITEALMRALGPNATLLQHDWYYRDQSNIPTDQRATLNFDHPEAQETSLLTEHLDALRAGQPIEAPQYDFTTHSRAPKTRHIGPVPMVVVEGINTLVDDTLRARFDLTVFVDAPPDIRFIRRLQRDIAERGRTAACVIRQYLEQVRPMHNTYVEPCRDHADLVLSGEADLDESVHRILEHLGMPDARTQT